MSTHVVGHTRITIPTDKLVTQLSFWTSLSHARSLIRFLLNGYGEHSRAKSSFSADILSFVDALSSEGCESAGGMCVKIGTGSSALRGTRRYAEEE